MGRVLQMNPLSFRDLFILSLFLFFTKDIDTEVKFSLLNQYGDFKVVYYMENMNINIFMWKNVKSVFSMHRVTL